jgi:hypothetical protein
VNQSFLTIFACLALSVCGTGLMFKLFRIVRLGWSHHIPASYTLIDAPSPLKWSTTIKKVLFSPAIDFHCRSCRSWTVGYALYHTAIFMVFSGYAVSGFIIGFKIFTHAPLLDFASGTLVAGSTTISNVIALIFGNAEQLPSDFIFGKWASAFRVMVWCELPFAITGNVCLFYTLLKGRMGAVRHDLDIAAQNLRLRGEFSGQHLLVRSIIFSIILMEFIGHLGWIPGIAYAHAGLGMLLIALFPFTYLVHIPLAPLSLGLAMVRRRRHSIA